VALKLYEAASFGSIPPQVGNTLMWGDRSEMERMLLALDQALRLLEEGPQS
jgi:hypothetical protein